MSNPKQPLSIGLPAGMRDLLPPRASHRRALARVALDTWGRYGYALVGLPAYEHEDTIVRGLGGMARRELVRFLDPDSGEVMVLRPDMTPQIARVAATRFAAHPGPLRLAYEGSVVRRPSGRARRQRQLAQAGIECIGWDHPDADVEVIDATLATLRALGLRDLVVELSHAAALDDVIDRVAHGLRADVIEAVAARDGAAYRALLGAQSPLAHALDRRLSQRGPWRSLAGPEGSVEAALTAVAAGLDGAAEVLVDLGELRGRGYYTGVFFQVLSADVATPLAAGGRYDGLLGRYGAPRAATGAAIDLEAVEAARAAQGLGPLEPPRRSVLVIGPRSARRPMAAALRAEGAAVTEVDDDPARADALAASGPFDAVHRVSEK
ncbi:MAG: ATP phosphoribosyltransferase regulatory subunit [Myxococcales bacterium]|nr:ATP phosphoribosyltransferase regulatory subunit [Myxococcales bacterium]